jgi:quercetin dioxygenase-like cupin family protein
MSKVSDYINSGILELYVLGMANESEVNEVLQMASLYPEVNAEIDAITTALMQYSSSELKPHKTIGPIIMATIDYMERLKNGEQIGYPPELNEYSKPEDFREWTDRMDMILPENTDEIYGKIIGHTPQMTTILTWLKTGAPDEIHHDQYERFLILEGTCTITVEDKVHLLKSGDYFAIPLHANHFVTVTSEIPCKVILQRVAA